MFDCPYIIRKIAYIQKNIYSYIFNFVWANKLLCYVDISVCFGVNSQVFILYINTYIYYILFIYTYMYTLYSILCIPIANFIRFKIFQNNFQYFLLQILLKQKHSRPIFNFFSCQRNELRLSK